MLKLIRIGVPITRVDDEERIVEGYAFVNETVPGENGMRLKREAMEAATPDYLKWGAIRAMHQPIAAGTALSVEWDEKGALLRAKVVDDDSWNKVKEGVYKAFSIGVRADVVRGKNVESCTWIENSLVDRPADKDAVIDSFRIQRYEPMEGELCSIDRWAEKRGTFNDLAVENEKYALRWRALDYLDWALTECLYDTSVDEAECERLSREAIQEFTDYWFSRKLHIPGPLEIRCERPGTVPVDLISKLCRLDDLTAEVEALRANAVAGNTKQSELSAEVERLTTENAETIKRAETAERALAEGSTKAEGLQSDVKRLESEVEKLRNEPRYIHPIVHTQSQRTVVGQEVAVTIESLKRELDDVTVRGAKSQDETEKAQCFKRAYELKALLAERGVIA